MKLKRAIIIPLICVVFFSLAISAVMAGILTAKQKIPTNINVTGKIASIPNLGVYLDPEAKITCATVTCGNLSQDSTSTKIIYIKNIGNVPETLKMITINCNPLLACSPLTLTWNQEGTILEPGSIVPATINLKVESNTGSFSDIGFNVVITGTV
jgi:hypothetical protein